MSVESRIQRQITLLDLELDQLYIERERVDERINAVYERQDVLFRALELVKAGEDAIRIQTGIGRSWMEDQGPVA